MTDPPRTKAEAKRYRYDQWAGNPKGYAFNAERCAYAVWKGWHVYQCSRKPGHGPDGLYCVQHAKKVMR